MNTKEIVDNAKNIAVIGISTNPSKAANSVPKFFHSIGKKIIPINPTADEIFGQKAFKTLDEVDEDIDILNVFRPSDEIYSIVKQAVERRNQRGDINLIWVQLGVKSAEAKILAEENGIQYIENKCLYIEYLA